MRPAAADEAVRRPWTRRPLVLAVLVALSAVALAASPSAAFWKRWSARVLAFARRPTPPRDVVVVYLDESSRQALGQPSRQSWDRALHARLVNRLRDAGAKTVVFDIVFDAASSDPAADTALADAIQTHGNVVLAAEIEFVEAPLPKTVVHLPDAPLRDAAAEIGLSGFLADGDGVVRSVLHRDPNGEVVRHSLSRVAAERHLAPEALPSAPDRAILNLYPGPDRIRSLTFQAALSSETRDEVFRDALVFVGALPAAGFLGDPKDRFPTEWTALGGGTSPGVDLHAAACANLLTSQWIRNPSPPGESAVLIVTAAILSLPFVLRQLRGTAAWVAGFGGIGSLAVFAIALGSRTNHAWLAPAIVQTPLALVLLRITRGSSLPTPAPAPTDTVGPPDPEAPTRTATRTLTATADTVVRTDDTTESDLSELPNLRVLARIGGGAFGEVYLARNPVGHFEAVKVIARGALQDKEFQALIRFQPISRRHPGLLDVHHVGRLGTTRRLYYTLTLADDLDRVRDGVAAAADDAPFPQTVDPASYKPACMKSVVERYGPVPFPDIIRIAVELADALAYLHRLKLVHRDIKPANVLLVDGRPVIADISLLTDEASATTFAGTPGFMPPEGPGSQQADIYALGRTLYVLSTGLPVQRFPHVPEGLFPEALEPGWRRILETAGNDRVSERYQDVPMLLSDLRALLDEEAGAD